MSAQPAQKYDFEVGVYRPPSEGGSASLLLRLTRNCPWNRCEFCAMYKTEKFELRSPAEVKSDIDQVADICNNLRKISMKLGHGGSITREAAIELLNSAPELNYHQGFVMVFNWLQSGAKTAFLQVLQQRLTAALRMVQKIKCAMYTNGIVKDRIYNACELQFGVQNFKIIPAN